MVSWIFVLMVPRTSREKISSHHGRLFCFFILSGTQPEKWVGATAELTHNLYLVQLQPHLYMTSMHLTLSQIFMEKVYACSKSADVRSRPGMSLFKTPEFFLPPFYFMLLYRKKLICA